MDYFCQAALAVANEVSGTTTLYQIELPDAATNLEFLGGVSFETRFTFNNTEVGGISGLTYDVEKGEFIALSEDRSTINDARFYNLAIDLSDGSLDDGDITFTQVTSLLNVAGRPFSASSLDPEGIALTEEGTLYIFSEGDANNLVDPFVAEFSLDGQITSELDIPDRFLRTVDGSSDIRNQYFLFKTKIK